MTMVLHMVPPMLYRLHHGLALVHQFVFCWPFHGSMAMASCSFVLHAAWFVLLQVHHKVQTAHSFG
jgi:hypothetical protein